MSTFIKSHFRLSRPLHIKERRTVWKVAMAHFKTVTVKNVISSVKRDGWEIALNREKISNRKILFK